MTQHLPLHAQRSLVAQRRAEDDRSRHPIEGRRRRHRPPRSPSHRASTPRIAAARITTS